MRAFVKSKALCQFVGNKHITFANFSNGTYEFFVQANLSGCSTNLSEPVNVSLNTIPGNQAFAGRDTVICSGDFELRAATPAIGTGIWTQEAGSSVGVTVANPNDPKTPIDGLSIEGGPYTFRWTLSNGACRNYSFDAVMLEVSSGETAQAGDNILACADEIVNLSAIPVAGTTSNGKWTQPEAQNLLGVTIVEENNPTTLIEGLAPDNVYVFTWTVTSDCGISEDGVNVTISDPAPYAGPDTIACNDQGIFQLQATKPTSGSQGNWTSDNGDPDNFLYVLLSCDGVGGSNRAQFCNKDFDNLLLSAKKTSDMKKRTALYEEAQLLFKEEAPWVTIAHSVVYKPVAKNVVDFKIDPFGGHSFYGVDLK